MLFFDFLASFMPIILGLMGVLMVVLRAGASRVFFDIVGTFQAGKLIKDTSAHMTIMQGLVVDGLAGIEDAGATLAQQMNEIVDATVPLSQELEKATIQFEKFISAGAAAEGTLTRQIKEVGMQFGFTANQSLEAGSRMAQLSSILGEDVIPQATEAALAFGLMGDMTPETAMIKLINLQQQTGFAFRDTTQAAFNQMTTEQKRLQVTKEMARTLNELNSVEDHSAATLSKITGVMNEFASQAHLAGESIAMMAAQSAALIEAGEEQGKAGRALRMTYARLGADTSGAASALHELGVETQNANGSLKPMSEIMHELNPLWKTFNSGQKQAIAQQVAGNRHYVRFIKLMEAYDRVMQLNMEATEQTAAVMTETGEAVGFLGEMMDSNAVKLDRARAELEMVNATLGNIFIPGQIRAIQVQTRFNEAIGDTLEGLGGTGHALSGLFGMGKTLQTTFAPFFSAFLNIKGMNLAMLTQLQIVRALSGVKLAGEAKERQSSSLKKTNIKQETDLLKLQMLVEEQANIIKEKEIKLTQIQSTLSKSRGAGLINQRNVQEALNAAEKKHAELLKQVTVATEAATISTRVLTMEGMKLSMTLTKITGSLMVVDVVLMSLASLFGDKLVMGIDLARLSMIMMGITMTAMVAETIFSTSIVVKETMAIHQNTAAKNANAVANLNMAGSGVAAAGATTRLGSAISFLGKRIPLVMAGTLVAAAALEVYTRKNKKAAEEIDNTTQSIADLEQSLTDVNQQVSMSFGADIDMSGLDAMQDATAKFSSGREEMFMGFKAGNITGDLIKQVQQGGVENFVANTEIIMNNNFTGLTSDQIAQEVISQIQRTATGNGIIVS